jgi:cobyrinic acid a,c-diamide synthase
LKDRIPRVMIVGSGSGCGKTTVTCALLAALKEREKKITAFKCGPDYIDPMFHSEVLGTRSRNLDIFLCGEDTVRYLLASDAAGSDMAVIEGVMGMYDGAGFEDDDCSANHISRATATPELLVVNVRGKSLSLAAEVGGYLGFMENNIRGVILNNCSSAMYGAYEQLLREKLGVRCYGYMPYVSNAEIGSRHLGLITAAEIADLKERMKRLGQEAMATLDLDGIMELAAAAGELEYEEPQISESAVKDVPIAIARDKAFCFYYEDSLELLRRLGARLIPFSPLEDRELPAGVRGIIIGGGYPEVHIAQLSENKDMMASIRKAVKEGMPVYAECGGFMYLGQSITEGAERYETVGAIPGNSVMTDRLVRFGYKTLTARKNNLMCRRGDTIKCHEFHYSDTDDCGDGFTAANRRGRSWDAIQTSDSIFAGYPHLHLWSNVRFAENFVEKCRSYGGGGQWR